MAARPASWLDLSTGINPGRGQSRSICRKAYGSACRRAPKQEALTGCRAKTYGVPGGAGIAAAAGTQALIQLLPYLGGAGPVAIVGPTYSEHAVAWRNAGHAVIAIDDLEASP